MGGDVGASLTVPAALRALEEDARLSLALVGRLDSLEPLVPEPLRERCRLVAADSVVGDSDRPLTVLRGQRDSSMFRAVELVQKGEVEAMVSAGNTGALLMVGRHLLKTLPGIRKPAIMATIPGATQQTFLLDVGANPDCDARQLFEFAVMGSVLAESLLGRPVRVGLLNIGAEQHKGTTDVRAAAELLNTCQPLNYVGFIEANELFSGAADVVVCDGYVGNVTIKSSAGVANVIKAQLEAQIQPGLLARLTGLGPQSVLRRLSQSINPQRFNGASLLGLQGSIIKSHGNATAEGFTHAIQQAVREAEQAVPQLIADKVAAIMSSC